MPMCRFTAPALPRPKGNIPWSRFNHSPRRPLFRSDQKSAVTDAIKKINYAYVQIHSTGTTASEGEYTLEPVQPLTKEATLLHLSRNLFPSAYLAEHMQSRAADLLGLKVSAIEAQYRNTLSYPVIVY